MNVVFIIYVNYVLFWTYCFPLFIDETYYVDHSSRGLRGLVWADWITLNFVSGIESLIYIIFCEYTTKYALEALQCNICHYLIVYGQMESQTDKQIRPSI